MVFATMWLTAAAALLPLLMVGEKCNIVCWKILCTFCVSVCVYNERKRSCGVCSVWWVTVILIKLIYVATQFPLKQEKRIAMRMRRLNCRHFLFKQGQCSLYLFVELKCQCWVGFTHLIDSSGQSPRLQSLYNVGIASVKLKGKTT